MNEARKELKDLFEKHNIEQTEIIDEVAPELKEFTYTVKTLDTHHYKVLATDEEDALEKAKLGGGQFIKYEAGSWDAETIKLAKGKV